MGGQNAADCVAAGGEGDEPGADLDRHILGPQGNQNRQYAAKAKAGEESQDGEDDRIPGEAGRRCQETEQRYGGHHRPATTEFVGENPEQNGAKHHADQRGAGQKSRLCGVNFKVRHDRRQRSAGNGDIVAV